MRELPVEPVVSEYLSEFRPVLGQQQLKTEKDIIEEVDPGLVQHPVEVEDIVQVDDLLFTRPPGLCLSLPKLHGLWRGGEEWTGFRELFRKYVRGVGVRLHGAAERRKQPVHIDGHVPAFKTAANETAFCIFHDPSVGRDAGACKQVSDGGRDGISLLFIE